MKINSACSLSVSFVRDSRTDRIGTPEHELKSAVPAGLSRANTVLRGGWKYNGSHGGVEAARSSYIQVYSLNCFAAKKGFDTQACRGDGSFSTSADGKVADTVLREAPAAEEVGGHPAAAMAIRIFSDLLFSAAGVLILSQSAAFRSSRPAILAQRPQEPLPPQVPNLKIPGISA